MNNTNKTKKVGFSETTAPAGESFTLNSAVAYINKVRMLSRNRCKCGGKLYVTEGMVLLTYPARYNVKCDCCGCIQTVSETDLIYETEYNRDFEPKTNTKPISINGDNLGSGVATLNISDSNNKCNHSFDVKLINGNYITYCTKCGKIGDSSQAPMPNFTNAPKVVDHVDAIPCLDPLRFTCVEGSVTTTAPSLDEAKMITTHASSTIGTVDKIYAGSIGNVK